ncbi:3'(2'),5'-bisphosphate nucleotidase CysQ [Phenylobacterium montanum]|uniref:3'(2'),5'-bisphosphate nucleotidase CysQ n=1 Tax=Phenylobacterium montanum TaxID=2823693 RepID=A0A975IWB0_9CAUL|nr:3'(2'),5'-bisphosphate nucleotidase CysQ [Caulobacter sp. S6]QUD89399.1 3'(2'),5'-bisphosphate nucleotidase CysQ [Caulobacter sp. S6]
MLDEIIAAAIAAGEAILEIYRQADFGARVKGDGSPVTEADARAEAIILEALAKAAPGVPVVAEEAVAAGHIPICGQRFFLVDPLDGTKEFLNRNGDFTVNIALIEDGAPVLGVVYTPAHGDVFVGEAGKGARRARYEDGRIGEWRPVTVRQRPAEGLDVVASRSHLSQETKDFIDRFPVAEMVSAGSSLKFCRVAAGEADLYPRLSRTMEWDTAAGDAVLRAAGGRVVTLDGRPLTYGKQDQVEDSAFANPWFVACGPFDPLTEPA